MEDDQEKVEFIVRNGTAIMELSRKYANGEDLSDHEKKRIAGLLLGIGNDMVKRSSRYLSPKKQGGQRKIGNFGILLDFYGFILDENRTKTYAYEILSERYDVSMDTIKNMVKEDETNPDGMKQVFFIDAEVVDNHKNID